MRGERCHQVKNKGQPEVGGTFLSWEFLGLEEVKEGFPA